MFTSHTYTSLADILFDLLNHVSSSLDNVKRRHILILPSAFFWHSNGTWHLLMNNLNNGGFP